MDEEGGFVGTDQKGSIRLMELGVVVRWTQAPGSSWERTGDEVPGYGVVPRVDVFSEWYFPDNSR